MMERKQLKIRERFLTKIYFDIYKGICLILSIIFIPLGFAMMFSSELIAGSGYLKVWFIWLVGITVVIAISSLIYSLMYEWISSRWKQAEKEVSNQRLSKVKNERN